MQAAFIVGAIVSAWVSGVGVGDGSHQSINGSAVWIVVSVLCGVAAWGWS